LADLDMAFGKDIETVSASGAPDVIRTEVINVLRQRHEERRAPYVRELDMLQARLMRG
jgi:hypothetical protein